jgi:hypothetical protein
MAHPVEELIRRASAEGWCCEPYCTTCGCLQFRTAIRDLPESIVDEFLSLPKNHGLECLSNYSTLLHLILFHQLPRTEGERLRAQAQTARTFEEMERRDAQVRAAAHERKLARLAEKRERAADKHRQRQGESARRWKSYEEITSMPLARRIDMMLANPKISPVFFQLCPEEIDDGQIAEMNSGTRAALASRISIMRSSRWRDLRTRLLRAL